MSFGKVFQSREFDVPSCSMTGTAVHVSINKPAPKANETRDTGPIEQILQFLERKRNKELCGGGGGILTQSSTHVALAIS